MKKYQNLPNKNIHSNKSSGKPLPNNSNYSRQHSTKTRIIEEDHQITEIHEISPKTDIVHQIVSK